MSDAGSNNVFVERDDGATEMDYDHGGVPVFVGIAWVAFIISFVVFMVTYALPDLTAWFGQ